MYNKEAMDELKRIVSVIDIKLAGPRMSEESRATYILAKVTALTTLANIY